MSQRHSLKKNKKYIYIYIYIILKVYHMPCVKYLPNQMNTKTCSYHAFCFYIYLPMKSIIIGYLWSVFFFDFSIIIKQHHQHIYVNKIIFYWINYYYFIYSCNLFFLRGHVTIYLYLFLFLLFDLVVSGIQPT